MRGRLPSDLLVTSGCRDEARGRDAVAGLAREGLHPRYHTLDITDEAAITRLRDHLREQYGGIDVLVNNAGLCLPSNTELAFGEQARVTLGLNYYSNKVMSSTWNNVTNSPHIGHMRSQLTNHQVGIVLAVPA